MPRFWPAGLLRVLFGSSSDSLQGCLALLLAYWHAVLLALWPFWHALILAFLRLSGLPTVFWPSYGFRDFWLLCLLAFVPSGLWLLAAFFSRSQFG
jgi:hypothetical protein